MGEGTQSLGIDLSKYSLEEQMEGLREGLRQSYKQSLYHTAKHLFGYRDMTMRTHGDMIRALEAKTERKLIVMPRGTFKSSIGSVAYPIWCLMNDPNHRILLDSELYTNSKNFLREITAHIKSDRFIQLFGDWQSSKNWNESEITITARTKTYKESSITCGGVGTAKTGQHYSTIIGDDYNSANNSQTLEGRQKIIRHYQMNLAILEPGGTYVIIATRYSVDDICGFILDTEKGGI